MSVSNEIAAGRDLSVVAGAVLRVWARGEVVGAAFLVAPGLVATTSTVVGEALGHEPGARTPSGPLALDLPLLRVEDEPPRVSARVQRWAPEHDVVLLRLTGPAPVEARMPPLRRIEYTQERSFSVLGFPPGLVDGVWTTGAMRPHGARPLLMRSAGEQRIGAGHAGAPVWEASTGAVVGMVTVGAGSPGLVPIDEVLGYDPERLPCPYPGLRPFGEGDAAAFFGRDADIDRLADAVERLPVVAVAGPSGAGKSSLVHAGLVPRLRGAGAEVVAVRAGAGPIAVPVPTNRRTVLIIDQFEELAMLDPAAAKELLERVVAHTGDAVRAVLTVRWSTLDELLVPELVETLRSGIVLVGPLDRARLRDVVVGPAAQPPGLAFENGLVERVLDDAGAEPGQLPLVESLLTDLWERRSGGSLTLRDYAAAGGVAGALAQHAERVIGPMEADPALPRLFTTLARPDQGGRFVRRAVPLDQLPQPQRALLPALTGGRLLVVGRTSGPSQHGGDLVELAHQSLIDHWPRLQGWLADDTAFLAWREQVAGGRERWEAEDRADTALLRGALLAGEGEHLPGRAADLPAPDLDYVRRSRARQRREVRAWRIVAAVAAVLALAAGGLTAVAVQSGNRIASQLASANAETLGRESQARAAEDPAAAVQLALAAWREDPRSPLARSALGNAYVANRSLERELPAVTPAPITSMQAAGDTVLLFSSPHVTVLTGVSGPAPARTGLPDVPSDRQVTLSADGRWLVNQTPDRSALQVRDVIAGTPPVTLPAAPGTEVAQGRVSPDGTRLTWMELAGQSARLRIWDRVAGVEVAHGLGPLPADTAALFPGTRPDGVVIRHGLPNDPDSRLVVHSLRDGAELLTLPAGSANVLGGAAGAACVDDDPDRWGSAAIVVTPYDGSEPRRIPNKASCFSRTSLTITADGRAAVERDPTRTGLGYQSSQLFDLTTGTAYLVRTPTLLQPDLSGTVGVLEGLTFLPGARPAALLARGTSLLWLATEPWPEDRPGERHVLNHDGYRFGFLPAQAGFFVDEIATGRRVTELVEPDRSAHSMALLLGQVWIARTTATGWDLARYTFPDMRLIDRFALPSRNGATPTGRDDVPPAVAVEREPLAEGGRAYAIADGVLSAWDPETRATVGTPITLDPARLDAKYLKVFPRLALRPGHPGQVAVFGPKEIQIWDVPAGRMLTSISTRFDLSVLAGSTTSVAFDGSGDRLAVLTEQQTLQLWNVDTGEPAGAPVPTPAVTGLVGFDADGYVSWTSGVSQDGTVHFLDPATGTEAGSVNLPVLVGWVDEARTTLKLRQGIGGPLVDLPARAQAWRDTLCSVVDRPFTDGELRLLPAGASTGPPCG
ncbi:hypothetical protein WEH80_05940 [Actinomycetes bacterium KLBMP 9759]